MIQFIRLKALLCLFVLLNSASVFSQNLVVDPSFENTSTNCSGITEGFTDLIDWDGAAGTQDSCSSSDLFSACSILIGGMGPTHMPHSQLGYQYSRTGTRHVGFITQESGSGWREYVQGKTSSPLVAGQTYCVSMYVSLANNCLLATNNIGVFFSSTSIQRNPCPGNTNSLINQTPHLNTTCVISDTAGWVRLQWNYTATGGERYFVIGNFFNNAATTSAAQTPGGGGMSLPIPMAYYYLDDVSIVPNPCCYVDINYPTGSLCVTAAPITLTTTPPLSTACTPTAVTGTWSGSGVSASGVFTPSVAGPGTHTLTYTLSCGSAMTTTISVSPCVPLAVCVEANGNLTASNGVAPYSWQNQTTAQDCSACLLGCALPPGCAVNVTNWTTFTTGTSIPAPTAYPIRVIDNTGTTLIINGAGSLPACTSAPCPTITVTVTSQANVGCGSTNNGTATVSASGGTGPYQYLWTPGNLTGATQNNLSAGTYTVTALAGANCTGSTTVTIGTSTTLSLTTTSVPASCGLNNGSATVNVTGGTGTYTYAWSPSGGSAATASNLAPGTYTVNVSGGGCSGTATVTVTGGASTITATVTTTGANCGASDGSGTVTPSGGTAPYTYAWSPSGGTNATASGLQSGAYSVLITDASGCSLTQAVNVPALGGPSLAISNVNNATCGQNNGSATVTATGGTAPYTYAWSPSGGTNATASGLGAGTYTVSVTDAGGCLVTQTVTITGGGAIVVAGTVTNENCGEKNGEIALTVTGGTSPYTYFWTPGNASTATYSGLSTGPYSVTVTDAGGCTATQTFQVGVIGGLAISANPSVVTITEGDSVQLTVSGDAVTYTWSPVNGLSCTTCDTLMAAPNTTTTYTIIGTDANGCSGTIEVTVYVQPLCSEIFVPTIFSPNSDGKNDEQCVIGNCIVEMNFVIYNRWGEKVFQTNDQNVCWDGMYKGKKVNTGSFVYKLKARLLNGKEIDESGNITVVQ